MVRGKLGLRLVDGRKARFLQDSAEEQGKERAFWDIPWPRLPSMVQMIGEQRKSHSKEANEALHAVVANNTHVPKYLRGLKRMPRDKPSRGDEGVPIEA